MNFDIVQSTAFSLYSTNPEETIREYNAGYFSNLGFPVVKGLQLNSNFRSMENKISFCEENDIFVFKSKTGSMTTIITDNCDAFKSQNNSTLKSDGLTRRCNYCRRDFVNKPFPVIYDIKKIDWINENKLISVDQCCSPKCAVGLAKERYDSIVYSYTKSHYNVEDPKPWRFLIVNGGNLTDEQWDNDNFNYKELPSVLYPIKRMYERY